MSSIWFGHVTCMVGFMDWIWWVGYGFDMRYGKIHG